MRTPFALLTGLVAFLLASLADALVKFLTAFFFLFDILPTQTLLLSLYITFAIKNRFSSVNIVFFLRTIVLLPLGRGVSSAA